MTRAIILILIGALIGIVLLPYFFIRQPEMPAGTDLKSLPLPFENAELLIDRTTWNPETRSHILGHEIFKGILQEVKAAETFLIVDFFLWNPWTGGLEPGKVMPDLSQQLANALIAKRLSQPDMPILVITDPVNRIYGGHAPSFFEQLAAVDIPVVFTDLNRLPDSNRIYAPQARFWSRYFGSNHAQSLVGKGPLPNPFDPEGEGLSWSAFGRLLYFKANHRKVLVSGRSDGNAHLIIGSLNPADGSAFHSNMAVRVDGAVARYAAESELAVAEWSVEEAAHTDAGAKQLALATVGTIRDQLSKKDFQAASAGEATVQWLSEGAIRRSMIEVIDQAGAGAQLDGAIFYFSDRLMVKALSAAIERGVEVRLLMDLNRDAFGREKSGIPNRAVAAELMRLASEGQIMVRWAATHGEQFHTKALRVRSADADLLSLGSSNWTRRNMGNLNLEANLKFSGDTELGQSFDRYFESLWTNDTGYVESLPYEDEAESGWSLKWKTWLYRFQEWSGASTF